MISEQLPPLPEPFMELHREISPHVYAAWAEQMRAYAAAALAQEREACAKVCDDIDPPLDSSTTAMACAAAIRARGQPDPKVTHLNEWARDRLARHGIQIPEDEDGNPSF
jgi:hypothetical protein